MDQGITNLQTALSNVQHWAPNLANPIVLISGFSGWGEPLFGTINYWGGFENIPEALQNAGYTVIVVRIGPLSSNWERACEVYRQIRSGFVHAWQDIAVLFADRYGPEPSMVQILILHQQ
ncbi:Alpha/Beta hydrolase fold [Fusarium oxysporum f. sp. vasinfectum]|nr:Alpha/Beta hydrolase fold [Fusarium oxysporum f. sp. vasinfectum]